ncbi:hypothetical protein Baya_8203 [Bagarius yarrelli]|uniref:Uncharacterized protein n=1 Tax=Bagarius yarrelli TaxID=175774 RepID=A0A556U5G6_BAGYA|nr:hypothetical protein Baya_8203 [Bagarius yarrelli]
MCISGLPLLRSPEVLNAGAQPWLCMRAAIVFYKLRFRWTFYSKMPCGVEQEYFAARSLQKTRAIEEVLDEMYPASSFVLGRVVNSIQPGLSMSQYRHRAPTARPSPGYGSAGHAEMAC